MMYSAKRGAAYVLTGTVTSDPVSDAVPGRFLVGKATPADSIVALRFAADGGVLPYIYLNNLQGGFLSGAPLAFPDGELSSSALLVSGDLDGDGSDDIGIVDPSRETFWFGRGDGSGAFQFSKLTGLPAGISSAAFSRINDTGVVVLRTPDGLAVVGGFGSHLFVQGLQAQPGAQFFDDLFGRGHAILGLADSDGLKVMDASTTQSAILTASTCSIENALPASVATSGRSLAKDLLVVSDCGQTRTVRLLVNPADVIVGTVLGDYGKLSDNGVSIGVVVHSVAGTQAPSGDVVLGYEGKVFQRKSLEDGKAVFHIQLQAGVNHLAVYYSGDQQYAPYRAKFTVRLPSPSPNRPPSQPLAQPGEQLSLRKQWDGLVFDQRSEERVRFLATANHLSGSFWLANGPSSENCIQDQFDGIQLTNCTASAPAYTATVYSNTKAYITFQDNSYDCGGETGICNTGYSTYSSSVTDNGVALDSLTPTQATEQGWCNDPYGDGTCAGGSGIEETQEQYQTAWGPNLTVGSHNLVVRWSNGDSYSFTENVLPAISWSTPAPIPVGTPLSSTQLSATFHESGSCSYNYPNGYVFASPGTYTLTVTCNPSDTTDYAQATASVSLVVQGKATPTLRVSCSPTTITYGLQTTTCSSSLTGGSSPTGSESWTINGTTWTSTGINGSVSGLSGKSPGTYTITATYSGDANNNSVSASQTVTIQKAPSSISAVCSPNPVTFGNSYTCTATVTAGATGTVTWPSVFGGQTTTLSGGTTSTSLQPATANAGTYTGTVVYNGDGVYGSSSTSITLVVSKATPSISLSATPNPSTYGAGVTLTATVTAGATGTVTFLDGTTPLGTGTISNAVAMISVAGLSPGTHTITATYSGDANNNSVSASQTVTVNAAVALACSPGTTTIGTKISCTATVPAADGTVYFFWPSTLTGEWWNGTSTSWYPGNGGRLASPPVAITHDATLNYNVAPSQSGMPNSWPNALAAPSGVNQTYVYARWTGSFVSPVSGTYTIGVNSDDGANVFVNGTQLVANLAGVQGAASNLTYMQSGTIALTAGAVNTIVVEYQQGVGPGGIQLLWTIPGSTTPTLLGWGAIPVNTSQQASISGELLTAGSSTVTAVWSGDSNYSSASATATITATAGSSDTIASSTNPSTVGQSVTFSGLVHTGGPAPTSSVVFADNGTNLSSQGVSALSTFNMVPDSNFYGASYWSRPGAMSIAQISIGSGTSGAFAYSGTGSSVSGIWSQSMTMAVTAGQTYTLSGYIDASQVTAGCPQWEVTDPSRTTVYGSICPMAGSKGRFSVTFTVPNGVTSAVVLAGATNMTVSAGGMVYWAQPQLESAAAAGPYILTDAVPRAGYGGQASYSTSTLAPGTHPITMAYQGDPLVSSSTSLSLQQVVQKAPSSISAVCSPNPVTFGNSYTCTATVTAGATGTVTWPSVFGGQTTTLSGGTTSTSLQPATANAGTYTGTVVYNGDGVYGSSSTSITLVVSKATPSISLSATPNPSTYGAGVTLTATVTAGATGTVTFLDGTTPLGTGTISNAVAMISVAGLSPGTHTITATYSGDANNNGVTSTTLTQVVNKAPVTVTGKSTPNPSTYGDTITLTFQFSGAGAVPTGTATISVDGTALATVPLDTSGNAHYTTSSLTAGSHTIVATYNGNSNYF
ncbi:Ig-like domain repeat protein [Pseudacidobacterium ailaaui]|uniref:Ig-like domain repeat protein n=1 Tax=Pseudacidobacterium ailaaui TaxID=1382359 RepID=UPI00138E5057|nr:Ig-like domain repeat protein [Pseudacidobacterium ailaaui]